MNLLIQTLLILFFMTNTMLFNFSSEVNIDNWQIVNDEVMGGLSSSKFTINDKGHGLFRGSISLDNNGGFSSVRYRFNTIKTSKFSLVKIKLKGDGKPYQFRIKASGDQRYSYIANVETTGEWETVSIPFSEMYPAFRGRLLDLSNYSGKEMTEIAFLIGNKKEETFALEIDYLELE